MQWKNIAPEIEMYKTSSRGQLINSKNLIEWILRDIPTMIIFIKSPTLFHHDYFQMQLTRIQEYLLRVFFFLLRKWDFGLFLFTYGMSQLDL